jgi:hypothetical protein
MSTDSGPTGSGRLLRRWRTAALLAAGIAIGVSIAATPVSGHISTSVTHLWNAHIKPKTDARYYTKAQANGRYLPKAGKAADANLLDGLDSAAFAEAGGYDSQANFFSFSVTPYNCDDLFGNLVGPSVTVDVGPSGLVAVWAEAQIQDFGTSLVRVQLFESSSLSSCPTILEGNAASNGGVDVKRTLPASTAGTTGFGAPMIVQVAPGTRTFILRYGLTPDAAFSGNVSQRKLWVQPL